MARKKTTIKLDDWDYEEFGKQIMNNPETTKELERWMSLIEADIKSGRKRAMRYATYEREILKRGKKARVQTVVKPYGDYDFDEGIVGWGFFKKYPLSKQKDYIFKTARKRRKE